WWPRRRRRRRHTGRRQGGLYAWLSSSLRRMGRYTFLGIRDCARVKSAPGTTRREGVGLLSLGDAGRAPCSRGRRSGFVRRRWIPFLPRLFTEWREEAASSLTVAGPRRLRTGFPVTPVERSSKAVHGLREVRLWAPHHLFDCQRAQLNSAQYGASIGKRCV